MYGKFKTFEVICRRGLPILSTVTLMILYPHSVGLSGHVRLCPLEIIVLPCSRSEVRLFVTASHIYMSSYGAR